MLTCHLINLGCGLCVVWLVNDSRVCWSSMLLVIIAMSSTHSRHVDLSILIWFVVFARLMSLLISSISMAYCVTAKTLSYGSYAVLYAYGPCQAMFSPDGGC